jgi:hypothetical protein
MLSMRMPTPAHFHAYYGEDDAVVSIDTLEVLRGAVPRRAFALVLEWAMEHRPELRENWELARAHRALRPISPLE